MSRCIAQAASTSACRAGTRTRLLQPIVFNNMRNTKCKKGSSLPVQRLVQIRVPSADAVESNITQFYGDKEVSQIFKAVAKTDISNDTEAERICMEEEAKDGKRRSIRLSDFPGFNDGTWQNVETAFPSNLGLLDETVYKGLKKIETSKTFDEEKIREGHPEKDDNENFYTRAGRAAKMIQQDFPKIFVDAPSMDIYTEDLAFVDEFRSPDSPTVVHGLESYQRQLWALRVHAFLLCSPISMKVLRMWQPQEKIISVRWSVKASPRIVGTLMSKPYYIDGLSEFKLNDEGFVYQHKVTRVDWDTSMSALKSIQKTLNLVSSNNGPMMPC